MTDDFLGGVIEGFYGRPWTQAQRLRLIPDLASWGLNTYFYAPKDDLKHRAYWREGYGESELTTMRQLADAADQHGIRFVYGLSPGLDIQFSDPRELEKVRSRVQQMIDIGVQDFALLFDDLPGEINGKDAAKFSSVAAAQISVVNAIDDWLTEQCPDGRLLFCPTPYCDRMDRNELGGTGYLDTIGQQLHERIDVFWTGPAIISEQIPIASIEALADRIGRPPIIWDNLHANDYDQRRLFCGPYAREPQLRDAVRGILINPNNEFPINYIPLRTLADYLNTDRYDARQSYERAARDWAEHFGTVQGQIAAEDVILLADCHYLPFNDGDQAIQLARLAGTLIDQDPDQWGDTQQTFESLHERVTGLFDQLSQLNDRELFYAWSRRIWDLREELDLISDFALAKRDGRLDAGAFTSGSHLPKTYRGGFVASLQRLLAITDDGKFVPSGKADS